MKKGFFKKAACAALSVMMIAGTTACGGGNDGKTLKYAVWGSSDEMAIIKQIVEGFETLYAEEGYKVDLVQYSSDYYNKIQLGFASKTEADVFLMQGGSIESYIRDNFLLNLQPYIEAETGDGINFTESDLWSINDGYRYNSAKDEMGEGNLYAIVKDWSPDFAMLYNKDLIDKFDKEEAPYTKAVKQRAENKLADIDTAKYPQFASVKGKKVAGKTLAEIVGYPTEASGKYPSETIPMSWLQSELMCFLLTVYQLDNNGNETIIKEVYGTNLDSDPLKFAQMFVEMSGTSLYTDDGKAFKYSTAGEKDYRIAKAYQHFINYQYGPLASSDTFGDAATSSDTNFPKGDVAVVWYGRWKCAKPTWLNINMGMAPPPTENMGVDEDNDGVEDNGNVYCSSVAIAHSISARTKVPDLAWKFIRYYMSVGLKTALNKGFNLPGNRTIALSDEFLKVSNSRDAKLNQWYVWLADYTHPLTYTKYVDNSVPNGILNTYMKSAANGTRTVEEALREIGNEINKEIARALN